MWVDWNDNFHIPGLTTLLSPRTLFVFFFSILLALYCFCLHKFLENNDISRVIHCFRKYEGYLLIIKDRINMVRTEQVLLESRVNYMHRQSAELHSQGILRSQILIMVWGCSAQPWVHTGDFDFVVQKVRIPITEDMCYIRHPEFSGRNYQKK